MPLKWEKNIDTKKRKAEIKINNTKNTNLYIDYDEVVYPDNYQIVEKDILNIGKNILEDTGSKDFKIDKAGENEYLLSYSNIESESLGPSIVSKQYFWNRLISNGNILKVINFIFIYPEKEDYFNFSIKEMLDAEIRNAQIS